MRGSFKTTRAIASRCFFAAAEPIAALAHDRIIAVAQAHDEIVNMGDSRRGFQLCLRRVRLGVKQIGADGVMEEVGLLRHHADILRHGAQAQVAQIVTVQADAPGSSDRTNAGSSKSAWSSRRRWALTERDQLARFDAEKISCSNAKSRA